MKKYSVGIPDEEFIRGKVPMTKEEIRILTLAKARIGRGDMVADIGAGTGSISCEAALQATDGKVFAIERKPEGIELIKANAEKFGIEDKSLQKLYANLFHMKISKAQRLSNWEQTILRDAQKLYAATDAWTCIKIYEELQRLSRDGDYELVEPVKLVEAESEVVKSKEAKNEEVPQSSPII